MSEPKLRLAATPVHRALGHARSDPMARWLLVVLTATGARATTAVARVARLWRATAQCWSLSTRGGCELPRGRRTLRGAPRRCELRHGAASPMPIATCPSVAVLAGRPGDAYDLRDGSDGVLACWACGWSELAALRCAAVGCLQRSACVRSVPPRSPKSVAGRLGDAPRGAGRGFENGDFRRPTRF